VLAILHVDSVDPANKICNKTLHNIKYSTVTKYISKTNYNIARNYTAINFFAFTLPVLETTKIIAQKKFITELI
jgi:hypothetical protein